MNIIGSGEERLDLFFRFKISRATLEATDSAIKIEIQEKMSSPLQKEFRSVFTEIYRAVSKDSMQWTFSVPHIKQD